MDNRCESATGARLNESEVRERLAAYKQTAVTDELYEFGKTMVSETVDRLKTLDNKAAAIAAYSIGLITVLASTRGSSPLQPVSAGLRSAASAAAFFAAFFAVWALALKKCDWFTQNEWINRDCLGDIERLRRFHVFAMWKVVGSHNSVCEAKAYRITAAQWLLLAAAVIIVISLLVSAFTVITNAVVVI